MSSAPGRGPEGTGNCSSCYEAQANKTEVVPQRLKLVVGDGLKRKVEAVVFAERIAPRSAPVPAWMSR